MEMGTGWGMVPTVLRHHYSCRLGLSGKLDEVKGTRLHVQVTQALQCMYLAFFEHIQYMYACTHIYSLPECTYMCIHVPIHGGGCLL